MSSNKGKMVLWIVIIVVIVVLAWWFFGNHGSSAPSTTPAATTQTGQSSQTSGQSNGNSSAAAAVGVTSQTSMTQDLSSIDSQMNALTTDSSNADQGLSDSPVAQAQ